MTTTSHNVRSLAISSAFLLALAGCGGGGDDAPAPAPVTLTGTVMVDQAIQNAMVCMDLNANSVCDAEEPASAKTGANGVYSLTYDANTVTAAQIAAASLIAPMVPGALADANTTIDAAAPTAPLTARAYVLKQVPGKSGQINPLTTLVAAGVKAGLAEAVARTNAATQLAITAAKLDNYQDDPAFNKNALLDNARLMAVFTAQALEAGANLAVSDLAAADAAPGDLRALNYTDTANYFIRTPSSLAIAAGSANADYKDLRSGLSAGTPSATNVLYPSLYLTSSGWTRCTETATHTGTRGVPSRDTYCGVTSSVGYPLLSDISGQTMASVVTALQADSSSNTINNGISTANLLTALGTTTFPANSVTRLRSIVTAMQADAETNTINNGLSTTTLLAALGNSTFPAGSSNRTRINLSLSQPIFINNSRTDYRPQAEATTLEQLIAAKPASGVNLTTSGGSLSLGYSTSVLRNLRVAFTGTTSPTAGTVQFYDCDLNAADQPSNCTATQTGTYSINTINGVRVMAFAGHAPTTYSTQVNFYAEAKGTTPSDWYVYRARQAKPTMDANIGSNKRINATAWAAMKAKLGL